MAKYSNSTTGSMAKSSNRIVKGPTKTVSTKGRTPVTQASHHSSALNGNPGTTGLGRSGKL